MFRFAYLISRKTECKDISFFENGNKLELLFYVFVSLPGEGEVKMSDSQISDRDKQIRFEKVFKEMRLV
jgi:hypothetical protein